jgi:hypothetical protein
LLRRREGLRVRVDPHRHPDGTLHVHLHGRAELVSGRAVLHHPHTAHPLRRALIVGAVHGLTGSALIGVLAAGISYPGGAIAYAGVFGIGATAGMLALSVVISLPLRAARIQVIASMRRSRVALAVVSIAIGIWISVQSVMSIASPVLDGSGQLVDVRAKVRAVRCACAFARWRSFR